MRNPRQPIDEIAVLLYGILFLFFFQLLTDFVAAIYAFGLLGTGIPIEIVFVLLFFSPLLLLIPGRDLSPRWVLLLALLFLLARSVEVLLDTRSRLLVSGLGVGLFLLYFPSHLWSLGKDRRQDRAQDLSAGLLLALLFSILMRALNSGIDLSTDGGAAWVAWLMALMAAYLLALDFRRSTSQALPAVPEETPSPKAGLGKVAGLCLGITAVFMLLYIAFIAPNVLARWAEAPYLLVLLVVLLAVAGFAALNLVGGGLIQTLPSRLVYFWSVLFTLGLAVSIYLNQLHFSPDPQAYPFYELSLGFAGYLPLLITILLFPFVFLGFSLLCRELILLCPPSRYLAAGFGLGALYMLLMVLAHVFTTTYDYIPVIGGFFRNKFWLVYLVAGTSVALPLLLVRDRGLPSRRPYTPAFLGLVLLIAFVSLLGAYMVSARPEERSLPPGDLRVMTYNIQQGYSEAGLKNYDGQLALIRNIDPHVLGLQETDTNRIANSNDDMIRYFADRLDMVSYYGPEVVQGTFGIALLSKYPLLNPQTFYMYSQGEQTATIRAQVEVQGVQYNLFVTHLGNGGPLVQQEAILAEAAGLENVILMGDFNFRPDTEQYQRTVILLADAWLSMWPGGDDGSGMDSQRRIDHIFISPTLEVLDARFLTQPESDHPALVAVIR
jgi:endonuclease/exonuclease/phosphatase family metal-dependent hydrolase